MICAVEIASDMSAWRAVGVGEHRGHALLHAGRDGADDEGTGSDFAGHGEADHVVAGSGDYRDQRPADAALAGETVAQKSAGGGGGESSGAVSGEVLRSERAALSREAASRAPGRDQL